MTKRIKTKRYVADKDNWTGQWTVFRILTNGDETVNRRFTTREKARVFARKMNTRLGIAA